LSLILIANLFKFCNYLDDMIFYRFVVVALP